MLSVRSGLTLNGALTLLSGENLPNARLKFLGEQLINGTGEIRFTGNPDGANRNLITFVHQQSGVREVLTIGPGITIGGGMGTITSNNPTEDTIRILGTVVGSKDGLIVLDGIDNQGGILFVDAPSKARQPVGVFFNRLSNTIVNGVSANTTIGAANLSGVTLNVDLLVDTAKANQVLSIANGLVLNSNLILNATTQHNTTVNFHGGQTVSGNGKIVFSGNPFRSSANQIVLTDSDRNTSEFLTFGEGITIEGRLGQISSRNPSQDWVQILGIIKGEKDGRIELLNIINQGKPFTIDAPDGGVFLNGSISNAIINGTDGSFLQHISGGINRVTLNIDFLVDAELNETILNVASGLTINKKLVVAGYGRTARVRFFGEQLIDGTGEIVFAGLPGSVGTNRIEHHSTTNVEEKLTFGENLSISGFRGEVQELNPNQDFIQIFGKVVGMEGGEIRFSSINNLGLPVLIDAPTRVD